MARLSDGNSLLEAVVRSDPQLEKNHIVVVVETRDVRSATEILIACHDVQPLSESTCHTYVIG